MRFTIEQRFAAPLSEVEAVYSSPDLFKAMAELPKLGGAELLDQRVDGDRVHQRVRYRFTGNLNSAVTAVIDPELLTWVETAVLDRTTHLTTWSIEPDNYASRLDCSGTFQLIPSTESATRRITEAEINVHFPLVGGRVEKAIISGLREHAEAEQEAVASLLQST